MLSDNGAVFTGRTRGGGRVALEVTLHARGISFRHSRPYHPQTCGKVERFHQTLKNGSPANPAHATCQQLQTQLDTFRGYYNTLRPHRALGRRTPADAYAARPKAAPTGTPIDDTTTAFATTRSTTPACSPCATTAASTTSASAAATPTPTSWSSSTTSTSASSPPTANSLRELHLDPTRDYQPQAQM